jgi:hypothetical protein
MHLDSFMSPCVLILEFLQLHFYNLFIGHSSLSIRSWHPRENLPDLDTLPMIRTCAIFVAGGFLLKKNMRRIGCSTRICHQRFVRTTDLILTFVPRIRNEASTSTPLVEPNEMNHTRGSLLKTVIK